MKCSKCGREAEDGYKRCAHCRAYEREWQCKWRKANPEKAHEKDRKRREKHRDSYNKASREWRKANPERVSELNRAWSLSHPDYFRNHIRKWRDEHPEAAKLQWHIRKARKNGNGGTFTAKELNELFELQEGFCFYCGELLYSSLEDRQIHIDHKIPISRDGTNDILNIVLSCARCNLQKGTMTDEEFLQLRNG